MYRQKLNPRLLFSFQSKVNSQVGLMSILAPSNTQPSFTNSSELQRFTRLEEAKYRETLNTSAIKIQKNFRMFSAMNQLKFLKKEKEFRIKTISSIKIQSHIRGFLDRKKAKFLSICKKVSEIREHAARIIKKRLRFIIFKKRINILALAAKVSRIRKLAALQIQKRLRGFLVRKDLFYIKSSKVSMLIVWRYPAKSVFICGNFTYPPWKVEIPLVYSKYFNGFCSGFFIENRLKVGDYLLKFIVDGCWLCDGKYPITQDLEGNYNNLIKVLKTKSKLPRSHSINNIQKPSLKLPDFPIILPNQLSQKYVNRFLSTSNSNLSITLKSSPSHTSPQIYTSESQSLQYILLLQPPPPSRPFAKAPDPHQPAHKTLQSSDPDLQQFLSNLKSTLSNLHKSIQTPSNTLKILQSTLSSYSALHPFSTILTFLHNNMLNILNSGSTKLIIFRKRHKTGQLSKIFQTSSQTSPQGPDPSWVYYSKSLEDTNWMQLNHSNLNQPYRDLSYELSPINQIELQPDDIVLLATDCVFTYLSEDYIKLTCQELSNSIYTPQHYSEKIAKRLVQESIIRRKNWVIDASQNNKNQIYTYEHQAIVAVACADWGET